MDYVFFAFSAMCLGLTVWLAMLIFSRTAARPRIWWVLLAGCLAAIYYYVLVNLWQHSETLIYLANILPQVLLLAGLGFLLRRRPQ